MLEVEVDVVLFGRTDSRYDGGGGDGGGGGEGGRGIDSGSRLGSQDNKKGGVLEVR